MSLAAVVLAGGRGRRMGSGGPKPLVRLGELRLIDHVLSALPARVDPVLLSANHAAFFAGFGLPVLPDRWPGSLGPLAGLDAAAAHISERHPAVTRVLGLSGDTPFLSRRILLGLLEGDEAVVRIARHQGRLHPTVGVWTRAALAKLPAFLDAPGKPALLRFLDLVGFQAVDFPDAPDAPGGDPFFNINTPEDLETARRHLARR